MSASYHIRYLQRQEIDTVKWDLCIEKAPDGLIYARAFYLDHMAAGQWDALVLNDYTAVLPLPWKKKFSFQYIYQPYYLPFLGVFGNLPSGPTVSSFLRAIPGKFKYWDIDLTESCQAEMHPSLTDPTGTNSTTTNPTTTNPTASGICGLPCRTTLRLNHLLALAKKKEEIDQDYKRLAKRMCKKAIAGNLDIFRDESPALVIDLYRKEYGHRHPKVRSDSYRAFTACAQSAFNRGNAATYLAKWPDGEIGGFYLVLRDNKFVYSILGGSTRKGKEMGAFYLLTDAAIKDHAGSGRVFRFEGSDIPGIAFFNAQFGSTPVHYPHLIMNNLPFPFNLLK